jgi:hypothetical protein
MSYYITDINLTSLNNPNDLPPGPRIIHIENLPEGVYLKRFEGPFESIKKLKSRSTIFKNLCISNPRRAEKIQQQKNIFRVPEFAENIMLTPNDAVFPPEFMTLLNHTIRGKNNSKGLTGIHYFNKDRMRIREITKEKDTNGIWEAIIELENSGKTNYYKKKSTFFPMEWNPTRLLGECYSAFKVKKKSIARDRVFKSITPSGIPVEIVLDNDKPKSIYPVHMSDILKFT